MESDVGRFSWDQETLITPLYQEEDSLHLLYRDISGEKCKYKYKIGKGILFGSDFNHSTEQGQSSSCSIFCALNLVQICHHIISVLLKQWVHKPLS